MVYMDLKYFVNETRLKMFYSLNNIKRKRVYKTNQYEFVFSFDNSANIRYAIEVLNYFEDNKEEIIQVFELDYNYNVRFVFEESNIELENHLGSTEPLDEIKLPDNLPNKMKEIHFDYKNNSGEESNRTLTDITVINGKDGIYLKGFDSKRQEVRTFSRNNIQKVYSYILA